MFASRSQFTLFFAVQVFSWWPLRPCIATILKPWTTISCGQRIKNRQWYVLYYWIYSLDPYIQAKWDVIGSLFGYDSVFCRRSLADFLTISLLSENIA